MQYAAWWLLTDSSEYNAWEGVSQYQLENTSNDQQKTTQEDDGATFCQLADEKRSTRSLVSYVKAIPFPLAPLQAIRQQESGVVVMTNPPSALEWCFDCQMGFYQLQR